MCTNTALVESLECYMDELVDCFEDFVKKSLVLVSVALGSLVLMIMYILKVLASRSSTRADRRRSMERCASDCPAAGEPTPKQSETSIESDTESRNEDEMSVCAATCVANAKSNTTSTQVSSRPSFDEKVLREIGLSSVSKPCIASKRVDENVKSGSQSKQSQPTCISKHHLSSSRPCSKYVAIRTSCCSMCCVDDDRR